MTYLSLECVNASVAGVLVVEIAPLFELFQRAPRGGSHFKLVEPLLAIDILLNGI